VTQKNARPLEDLAREAQDTAERGDQLREHLVRSTAAVDGLVVEARSTLKRAVDFLERQGLRGTKSGTFERIDPETIPRPKPKDPAPER
jgi:hypothetical protein